MLAHGINRMLGKTVSLKRNNMVECPQDAERLEHAVIKNNI